MSDRVEIIVTATDEASKTLREIGNVAGGLGNVLGGALKIGLAGAAVGLGALGAGLAKSISEAMDAEGTMSQLDAVLRSTGAAAANSVAQVPHATKEAAAAIKDATTAHADGVRDATESAAEAAQALTERAIELAERHKDRIDDINASIRDANTDFAENQQERQERLQERIGDIEERAGEQREDMEERLREATSQKEKNKIGKQIAELDAKTARQIEKAQAAAEKEESRAQKEHDKRIAALQKQIDRENKEYERQTAAIQKEREKQEKDAREHLAKVEAAYKKAMDAITEKFTAVERGVAAPMKRVEQISKEAILALSDSLSELTPFEDDAITGAQSMLLTFTNIGKDVFPAATETVLDMSQALGQDLKSSSVMLGKALNDPIQGVSALQRVGVSFTDAQKEQIKTLVESGRTMDAQKIILKELQTEFGGSAKAAGETFGGQMQILQNQIGNVSEDIGGAFLPTLKELIAYINTHILPAFKAWAEDAAPKIQAALKTISDIVGGLVKGDFTKLEQALTQGLDAAKKAFDENAPKYADAFWKWLTGPEGVLTQITVRFQEVANGFSEYAKSPEGRKAFGDAGAKLGEAIADGIIGFFDSESGQHKIGFGIGGGLLKIAQGIDQMLADIGGGIAEGMLSGIYKKLTGQEASDEFRDWIRQLISSAIQDASDFTRNLFNPFGMAQQLMPTIPGFDSGGIVPGIIGSPQLALVHGGETILPTHRGGRFEMSGGETIIVQLTYAPTFSFADEREFGDRLQPFIERGIIAARSRQVGASR